MKNNCLILFLILSGVTVSAAPRTNGYNADRNAYFGDLHVHTKNSSDAFIFNVRATPDDAYKYAQGESIKHASGFPIRLKGGALDFTAVTDHGELLGVLPAMIDSNNPMSTLPEAFGIRSTERTDVLTAFYKIVIGVRTQGNQSPFRNMDVLKSAWMETVDAAERHYKPGIFTTFVGYEYSSAPKNQNLHRNVIFKSAKVPEVPFSAVESSNPEDLWRWLDEQRSKGMDAFAIPHNSNVSNGLMFQRTDSAGRPLASEYALLRMRNEPIVEVTQVKGTSETHPLLSPNDEWAGFELYDTLIASDIVAKKPGGFVREAYKNGITFANNEGFNPYKFGLIGASDTHNAGGPIEEDAYFSKAGMLDGTAKRRGTVPSEEKRNFGSADASETFSQWGASGLAGIWAEENTRESLFDAMRRKETFATSGPRIKVRFFAGYQFTDKILEDPKMVRKAYKNGVPMGSDLKARANRTPSFLVWAVRDTNSTWLQRVQIIKGWVAGGESHEQVFDVACADGLKPNNKTHRCPDNNASVDLKDCRFDVDKGAVELKTLWEDPGFEPKQEAFYYVRVLENPTCRWSTWDALRAGVAPKTGLELTIQERAWSSPIWFIPKK